MNREERSSRMMSMLASLKENAGGGSSGAGGFFRVGLAVGAREEVTGLSFDIEWSDVEAIVACKKGGSEW